MQRTAFNATVLQEMRPEPLTREQEKTATPEQLVRHNMRFAVTIATRYANYHDDVNELISVAKVGMWTAAQRFDPERGLKFITYAVNWMMQSIQKFLAENDTIRIPANVHKDIGILRRYNSEQDAIDDGAITERQVVRVRRAKKLQDFVSYDYVRDGLSFSDYIPDPAPRIDVLLADRSAHDHLVAYINNMLSPVDADIITLYFGIGQEDAWTLEEIGLKYNLTRERIRQRKERSLKVLQSPRKAEHKRMRAELR